jgi:hypothetical protein
LTGDWEAAAAATREAEILRDSAISPLIWFDFARYYETEALLRAGERSLAEASTRRLSEHLGTNRRFRLVFLRMQALLDRDAGDHISATQHLSEALSHALEMGIPGEAWQIAAELAMTYTMQREAQRAEEVWAQSEAIIDWLASQISDRTLREDFARAARARPPALQ